LPLRGEALAALKLQPLSSLASQIGRSHDAGIRVYDEAGDVIETHKHKGEFKES